MRGQTGADSLKSADHEACRAIAERRQRYASSECGRCIVTLDVEAVNVSVAGPMLVKYPWDLGGQSGAQCFAHVAPPVLIVEDCLLGHSDEDARLLKDGYFFLEVTCEVSLVEVAVESPREMVTAVELEVYRKFRRSLLQTQILKTWCDIGFRDVDAEVDGKSASSLCAPDNGNLWRDCQTELCKVIAQGSSALKTALATRPSAILYTGYSNKSYRNAAQGASQWHLGIEVGDIGVPPGGVALECVEAGVGTPGRRCPLNA